MRLADISPDLIIEALYDMRYQHKRIRKHFLKNSAQIELKTGENAHLFEDCQEIKRILVTQNRIIAQFVDSNMEEHHVYIGNIPLHTPPDSWEFTFERLESFAEAG